MCEIECDILRERRHLTRDEKLTHHYLWPRYTICKGLITPSISLNVRISPLMDSRISLGGEIRIIPLPAYDKSEITYISNVQLSITRRIPPCRWGI